MQHVLMHDGKVLARNVPTRQVRRMATRFSDRGVRSVQIVPPVVGVVRKSRKRSHY